VVEAASIGDWRVSMRAQTVRRLNRQRPQDQRLAFRSTTHGQTIAFVHPVKLRFPATPLPDWPHVPVLGADLAPQGLLVLIGRDMLQFMTLVYSGPVGLVSISV
jgi:hypothetical protein